MLKSIVDSLDNKNSNNTTTSSNTNTNHKEVPISPLNISPSSSLSSSSFSTSTSSRQSVSFTSSTDKSSDCSFKISRVENSSKKLEKIDESSLNANKTPSKAKTKKFSFGFGKKLRKFLSSDKSRTSNKASNSVLNVETNDRKTAINCLSELKQVRTNNIEEMRKGLQNKLR